MTYRVLVTRGAQRILSRIRGTLLDSARRLTTFLHGVLEYERLTEVILGLADEPRPVGSWRLRGRDGWRIRGGDYRVIYDVDDAGQTVTVLHVGHRRDIYRQR